MIQKFTCIPKSEYDVIIVSNGRLDQIDKKLEADFKDDIPTNSHLTYLSNFNALLTHMDKSKQPFDGKVIFLFFNGLEFIQEVLSSIIDYTNKVDLLLALGASYGKKLPSGFHIIENAYFYFDSSISASSSSDLLDVYLNNEVSFVSVANIVNDILKKMSFMLRRVRNLYIDDDMDIIGGERAYPLRCLIKNFPQVEKIELSSGDVNLSRYNYF